MMTHRHDVFCFFQGRETLSVPDAIFSPDFESSVSAKNKTWDLLHMVGFGFLWSVFPALTCELSTKMLNCIVIYPTIIQM